jgi:hypothetical protein
LKTAVLVKHGGEGCSVVGGREDEGKGERRALNEGMTTPRHENE